MVSAVTGALAYHSPYARSVNNRAFHPAFEVLVFLAAGAAADQSNLFQEVGRLEHVALFDVPHSVVLPRAHVIRVDCQRLVVPDLGEVVVADLAVGVADIVGDFRAVVAAECLEGGDAFLVLAVEHQRAGGAVTVDELLLLAALVLLFLLTALLSAALGAAALGLWRCPGLGVAGGEHRTEGNRKAEAEGAALHCGTSRWGV